MGIIKSMKTLPKSYLLTFKWTTSKARDSEGWNVVTPYIDGKRIVKASAKGGGYDMKGTAFGNILNLFYSDRLKALFMNSPAKVIRLNYALSTSFSGLAANPETGEVWVDGSVGFNTMENITRAINLGMQSFRVAKNDYGYVITDQN
mgnify:CR=1 FL=1